ncbi:MAG: DUF5320 domain-containing protein [Phycisphaerae bacterium]|nr:DUF5320 domain-containing protein [Phycisphaerae bacterium]
MPGGNGTGPAGAGPMTGRGMGICAGFKLPGYANNGSGRGLGMGRGGRMGRGRGFGQGFGWAGAANSNPAPQNLNADQELESLKTQANYIENSLKEINQRIDELQTGNT